MCPNFGVISEHFSKMSNVEQKSEFWSGWELWCKPKKFLDTSSDCMVTAAIQSHTAGYPC